MAGFLTRGALVEYGTNVFSTTFTAAWARASPVSPPTSGMPKPSATPACFSKAAAATSWPV